MSTHPEPLTWSLWTVGSEPGRQVAALGVAAVFTLALLDVAIDGRLGLFFDLTFVALCVGLALRVAPGSFFYVGVLPPLIMMAVLVVVAIGQPAAIAHPLDGIVRAVVTGLDAHATALLAGYALCLGVLFWRNRELTRPF